MDFQLKNVTNLEAGMNVSWFTVKSLVTDDENSYDIPLIQH